MLVVNEKDEVEVREVQLGSRHGNLVAVKEGLKSADRVVNARQQRLKVGGEGQAEAGGGARREEVADFIPARAPRYEYVYAEKAS